jgi:hypothetical protein
MMKEVVGIVSGRRAIGTFYVPKDRGCVGCAGVSAEAKKKRFDRLRRYYSGVRHRK